VVITTLVIAFAASSWVFAQESPAPAQYKAEEPANRSLDATLYVQTAAEYRASCYQAYNLATARLDAKRKTETPAKPFAVIMDLDETVLDNSPFQAMLLQNSLAWNKGLWAAWEEKHSGDVRAIPGAKEFIDQAKAWGIEVFYVSNRNVNFKQQAMDVLKALGVPPKDEDHLKLADPKVPNSSDKTARFNQVRDSYTVLLYLGDNLRDFDDQLGFGDISKVPDGELDGVIQARKAKVDNKAAHDRLGDDWIILPNPTYGEWKAPLGHGQSDFKRLAAASFPIPSPTPPAAKCDMIVLIPFLIIVLCFIWTLLHWPKETDLENQPANRDHFREFLVHDIRQNSQYAYWYLALIGGISTIVAANKTYFGPILNQGHVWPFGLAFLAASLALLFVPAGYGEARVRNLRFVWLRSVLCEQVVVVFTCYGIWEAFRALTATVP
jgi:acid phosphatase